MNAELEIEKALASITEASEQLRAGLNDVQKFKTATDTLNESSKKNSGLAELLQTTIDRFSTVAVNFDSAAKALSSEGIERFEKQLETGLDEVRQSTRLIKTEVQSIESSVTKELLHLVERMAKIDDTMATLRTAVSNLGTTNEESNRENTARIQELRDSVNALSGEMTRSIRTASEALNKSLQTISSDLDRSIDTLSGEMTRLITSTSAAQNNALKTMSEDMDRGINALSKDLKATAEASATEAAANRKWLDERISALHKQAAIVIACFGIGLVAVLVKVFHSH